MARSLLERRIAAEAPWPRILAGSQIGCSQGGQTKFQYRRSAALRLVARLLQGDRGLLDSYTHGFGPMQDAPVLLHLIYAILMVSSMMLTLQVHRLLDRRAK